MGVPDRGSLAIVVQAVHLRSRDDHIPHLGFDVWVLWFGASDSRAGVGGLEFEVQVLWFGCFGLWFGGWVWGLRVRIGGWDFRYRVSGLGMRVEG